MIRILYNFIRNFYATVNPMSLKNKIPPKRALVHSIVLSTCLLLSTLTAAAQPQIYAVVVGVSKYQQAELNGIKYADRDAAAFAGFLESPHCGSTPPDHIALLTNQQATRINVLKNVRHFALLASAEDVLIIYFAGHGCNQTKARDNQFFMETYDTDPDLIDGTATPASQVNDYLTQSAAKMIFWITDACNSGKIGPGRYGERRGNAKPSEAEQFLKAVASNRGGFVYLASSQSEEMSLEDPNLGGGHGVFTYYLLQGLSGKAKADRKGMININACYNYLREQVIQATGDYQHPAMSDLYFNGRFPMSCVGNTDNLGQAREKALVHRDSTPPPPEQPYFDRIMNINCYNNTRIPVQTGETIAIRAWGSINVGPFVGDSSPDGRESGLFGVGLTKYDIVKTFKHAVLMFKLAEQDNWVACGSSFKFRSNKDGELIFQVNDNDQSNNSGAYTVEVRKYR